PLLVLHDVDAGRGWYAREELLVHRQPGSLFYIAPVITRSRGLAELFAAAVTFGVMAYAAKHATAVVDGAQVAFVRFGIGASIVLAVRGGRLRVVRRDLLFLRGLFGGVAVLLFFLAIGHLPVGTATLYNYTAPVFSTTFAALFLHEALPAANVLALLMTGA